MSTRKLVTIIIGAAGLIVAAVIAWILISPLFIDEVVDEEFPIPTSQELADMPVEKKAEIRDDVMAAAAKMPPKESVEPMPEQAAQSAVLVQGQFRDADSHHKGSGSASLYRLADGQHVLRLEGFEVTNGPDLRVILSSHPNPANGDEVHQGFVDLRALNSPLIKSAPSDSLVP